MNKGLEASLILNRDVNSEYVKPRNLFQNIASYVDVITKDDVMTGLDFKKDSDSRKKYLHDILISNKKITPKARKLVGESLKVLDGIRYDQLTGCYDRSTIEKVIDCEIETSEGTGDSKPITCLFLDVDNFKIINDKYGHASGDYVLREVSTAIKSCLPKGYVARYGGDEFVVILPDVAIPEGHDLAETIKRKINGIQLPFSDLKLDVSIGLANYKEDAVTREELINAADKGMYLNKRSKRGSYNGEFGVNESVGFYLGDPGDQIIPAQLMIPKEEEIVQ